MSTKALKKELMAAVVMLLVAAIALSGSTFAWFAQNGKVTADNMQVTVKSDMGFLLISNGALTAAQVQAANQTVAHATITSAALYPTAPTGSAVYKYVTYDDTNKDTDATDSWYYQYSTDPAVSTGVTTPQVINVPIASDTAVFADYVLLNEFSVTVLENSVTMDGLRLSADVKLADEDATNSAVKVLVIASGAGVNTKTSGNEVYATFTSKGALIADLTNGTATKAAVGAAESNAVEIGKVDAESVIHIRVLVYWDGNDESVFTNNIPNLNETKVSINIEGNPVPQE